MPSKSIAASVVLTLMGNKSTGRTVFKFAHAIFYQRVCQRNWSRKPVTEEAGLKPGSLSKHQMSPPSYLAI